MFVGNSLILLLLSVLFIGTEQAVSSNFDVPSIDQTSGSIRLKRYFDVRSNGKFDLLIFV